MRHPPQPPGRPPPGALPSHVVLLSASRHLQYCAQPPVLVRPVMLLAGPASVVHSLAAAAALYPQQQLLPRSTRSHHRRGLPHISERGVSAASYKRSRVEGKSTPTNRCGYSVPVGVCSPAAVRTLSKLRGITLGTKHAVKDTLLQIFGAIPAGDAMHAIPQQSLMVDHCSE